MPAGAGAPLTCRDVIDLLVDYLETALAPEVLAGLEAHLADCAPCRAYLATYRATISLSARAQRTAMPDELRQRLRAFLLERLREPDSGS